MKVLVTGAKGFVGRNLCCALRNIADGKDRREKYHSLLPLTVYEYDRDGTQEELSFYSKATTDFEYLFPFGWGELWGVADRTTYDLTQHQKFSGQDMD